MAKLRRRCLVGSRSLFELSRGPEWLGDAPWLELAIRAVGGRTGLTVDGTLEGRKKSRNPNFCKTSW